jgi:hypothetical protein
MGVLAYADLDVDKMLAEDEYVGRNFIQLRFQPGGALTKAGAGAKRPPGPVQGTDSLPNNPPPPADQPPSR